MIGVSHLENLGTRENILKAKMEICTGLPDGAPLALNADNDLLPTASIPSRLRPVWFGIDAANADVRAVDVVTGANGTTFKIIDTQYGTFDAAIPTAGIHTVYDALAAYAAATRLGLGRCPLRCRAGDLPDDGHAPAYRGKGRHHLH
ncbi:Mur ligase family protein [Gemmiger formicilis]|uniref:Mur ligase family protein n=1 Tax=Gemmiger formicilis TaxID=745368 RepID=UPI003521CDD6